MVGRDNFSLACPHGGDRIVRVSRARVMATHHVSSYRGASHSCLQLTSIYISGPHTTGEGPSITPSGRRLLILGWRYAFYAGWSDAPRRGEWVRAPEP
eukprot:5955456-Pleurochrysis_carterae.AAC.4